MSEPASFELRPGVRRPDWSAVSKPAAREALLCRSAARSGVMAKWSIGLAPLQDSVWRMVVGLFARQGRAPLVSEIAGGLTMPEAELTPILRELSAYDLLGLDEATATILHAYPFAARDTGHRIELNGRHLNALCAIDALGVGAMCRSDATIDSTCQWCRTPIRIVTLRSGKAVAKTAPAGSVVWYDTAYEQSAASSCCPMIVFLCGDDHLRQWLAAQSPRRTGNRLAIDEALEVGRAIFGPILSAAHRV
jgi:hypothetical protein